MELKNKKVLITGGRAGIGKAIIKELVIRGVQDIAVMGRRKERFPLYKNSRERWISSSTMRAL